MKLAVPIWDGKQYWPDVELREPSPMVLADTVEAFERGTYRGMTAFCAGVIGSIKGEDGQEASSRDEVRHLVKSLPFPSALPVAIDAMLLADSDDGIEGAYECPLCDAKIICRYISDDDDTRDHVKDLARTYMGAPYSRIILFTADEPITISLGAPGGEYPTQASSFTIRFPTLADCMAAEAQVPTASVRQQWAIYAAAIEEIDGVAFGPGIMPSLAKAFVERLSNAQMRALRQLLTQYGIDPSIKKVCGNCGKEWEETVNTTNFFASALRTLVQ